MKIKFNWGTGIILALAGYVGIIALLLFISSRQSRSVMREDYYYHSIHYQDEIDAARRFADLGPGLGIIHQNDSVYIHLPTSLDTENVMVRVYFLRPSDEKLDFTVQRAGKAARGVVIPASHLRKGKYFFRLELEKSGKLYLHESDYIF